LQLLLLRMRPPGWVVSVLTDLGANAMTCANVGS